MGACEIRSEISGISTTPTFYFVLLLLLLHFYDGPTVTTYRY